MEKKIKILTGIVITLIIMLLGFMGYFIYDKINDSKTISKKPETEKKEETNPNNPIETVKSLDEIEDFYGHSYLLDSFESIKKLYIDTISIEVIIDNGHCEEVTMINDIWNIYESSEDIKICKENNKLVIYSPTNERKVFDEYEIKSFAYESATVDDNDLGRLLLLTTNGEIYVNKNEYKLDDFIKVKSNAKINKITQAPNAEGRGNIIVHTEDNKSYTTNYLRFNLGYQEDDFINQPELTYEEPARNYTLTCTGDDDNAYRLCFDVEKNVDYSTDDGSDFIKSKSGDKIVFKTAFVTKDLVYIISKDGILYIAGITKANHKVKVIDKKVKSYEFICLEDCELEDLIQNGFSDLAEAWIEQEGIMKITYEDGTVEEIKDVLKRI